MGERGWQGDDEDDGRRGDRVVVVVVVVILIVKWHGQRRGEGVLGGRQQQWQEKRLRLWPLGSCRSCSRCYCCCWGSAHAVELLGAAWAAVADMPQHFYGLPCWGCNAHMLVGRESNGSTQRGGESNNQIDSTGAVVGGSGCGNGQWCLTLYRCMVGRRVRDERGVDDARILGGRPHNKIGWQMMQGDCVLDDTKRGEGHRSQRGGGRHATRRVGGVGRCKRSLP